MGIPASEAVTYCRKATYPRTNGKIQSRALYIPYPDGRCVMKIGLIVSKLLGGNTAAIQTAAIVAGAIALNVGVIAMFKVVSEGPRAAEGTDIVGEIYEQSDDEQVIIDQSILETEVRIPDHALVRSSQQPP